MWRKRRNWVIENEDGTNSRVRFNKPVTEDKAMITWGRFNNPQGSISKLLNRVNDYMGEKYGKV